MIYLNLFFITSIIVFIIDLSGFVTEIETKLAKWLNVKKVIIPKPLSCSLCLTWWVCLAYLLIAGQFGLLTVLFTALLAYLTTEIGSTFYLVKSLLQQIISEIYTYFINDEV